jgi:peptide/nickel transport system permease protein
VLAGTLGGRVDAVVTYLVTVRLAMPAVIVALAVVALVGNSFTTIMCVLGLLLWDQFAIVSRSVARQVSSQEYVLAARSMGLSPARIMLTEILPNVLPTVVVVATVEMASAIMVEASLSFLGLGVQPPTPSWGLMMSEGRENIFFSSWLILFPGIALFVLIFGTNLIGDGLRDRLSAK